MSDRSPDGQWSTDPGHDAHGITFGAPSPPPGGPPPPMDYSAGPPPLLTPPRSGRLRSHPEANTILVLGILSVVICPLIGPLAWSMGNKAMGQVRYSGYVYRNAGLIRAGRILGAAATGLMVLYVILILAIVSRGTQTTPSTSAPQAPAVEVLWADEATPA